MFKVPCVNCVHTKKTANTRKEGTDMKYKLVATLLSISMIAAAVSMTGCSNKTTSLDGTMVYGEVTEVGEDSVTIEVGTQTTDTSDENADADSNSADSDSTASDSTDASNEKSDSAKADTSDSNSDSTSDKDASSSDTASDKDSGTGSDISSSENESSKSETASAKSSASDSSKSDSNSAPSGKSAGKVTLNLTGETQTITVTDDTEISMEASGDPGGTMGGAPNGEAPEKPDGDNNGNTPSGEAPEKPDGDSSSSASGENNSSDSSSASDKNASTGTDDTTSDSGKSDSSTDTEKSDSSTKEISLSDLEEGDIISIELDEDGEAAVITILSRSGGMGMNGGQSQGVSSYDAATEYTEDTTVDGESIESTGTDENAIHAYNGANVVLKNMKITRTSSDSTGGDNSSFYGVGAAVLDTDGTTYISNSTIDTDAKGAAGAFAYGDGTVYISDTTISTAQDTSGGIHVAGGGKLYAWDVTATTQGESSAAIRSDRGGGTMVVNGGTYTSNGTGSPSVYSTADISVNNATLTANGSEALCIEGLNSAHLFNCELTGNMPDSDQNDCTWNVILYQSMSGDSEVGNSTFEMVGGSLTAKNGGMFYTTNTESTFVLSDVDITYANDSDFFLRCTGNANERGWGTMGENGADCSFTGISQEMEGNVIWDSISQLDFYMTEGSTLTGAVVQDDTYANGNTGGYCNLYIDADSTWVVTGDSTVTSLDCAGTVVDASGNTVTIKGSDGTVYVKGSSQYTVTVDSYSTKGDVSGASAATSWSDYEAEKPSEMS